MNAIEQEVMALTRRVQRLHNGDFASLSFHSGSWQCSTVFTGIRSGAQPTPRLALDTFTNKLHKFEVSAGEAPPIERSA